MMVPSWFHNLSRVDFLKSVGLYVTPDRLFLVRMRRDLFRLSLVQEEVREIALGQDGSYRQALGEAIRSLMPHLDSAKDLLYICLSPHQSIGCQLFLPQVAEENLPGVVEYELERQLPFRREEVYYDFLPMGKKGDKIALFLFAVPKRSLDDLLDALSACGLKPKGVETTATALSNYLLFCTGGITGPALVLGGQSHAWEVIGLNAKTNGWGQDPELAFAHWLPRADWIQGPGREIFHGWLGESPRLFGWGDTADFLLSVEGELVPLEDLPALGEEKLRGNERMAHPFFLPAVGAALRGLRESTFPVNLLPGARDEGRGQVLSWLNTCLTVLLLLGLIAWGGSYPIRDEIRVRQLQKENQKLEPSVQALRREEEELHKLHKEISFLSGLGGRRGEIFLVLDELSRVLPNSAYLSNLRTRGGAVELQGSAENASNLVPLLERSPLFKNVGFNAPSNRGRDNRETFSLKAEIERPQGKVTRR
jgi:Tfp pilus assembly protein PilN